MLAVVQSVDVCLCVRVDLCSQIYNFHDKKEADSAHIERATTGTSLDPGRCVGNFCYGMITDC